MQGDILSRFPFFKPCYENIIHNKVSNYDFCLAIPKGEKCFVWFHLFQEKQVFYILGLNDKKVIYKIKNFGCSFDESLTHRHGTILYGTFYFQNGQYFFTMENIYYYKGNQVVTHNWYDKLVYMKQILKTDLKKTQNLVPVVFGLPYMSVSAEECINYISQLKYEVRDIEFRNYTTHNAVQKIPISTATTIYDNKKRLSPNSNMYQSNRTTTHTNMYPNTLCTNRPPVKSSTYITNREVVFKVKPDIQNDIYYLYCYDETIKNMNPNMSPYIEYDYAYIPDYKTSVYMNGLFRNIKENNNLDALEESDDEAEFENEKEDRFVDLQKEYYMLCAYNHKFKKWVPIRVANENAKVVNYKELSYIKNKYVNQNEPTASNIL